MDHETSARRPTRTTGQNGNALELPSSHHRASTESLCLLVPFNHSLTPRRAVPTLPRQPNARRPAQSDPVAYYCSPPHMHLWRCSSRQAQDLCLPLPVFLEHLSSPSLRQNPSHARVGRAPSLMAATLRSSLRIFINYQSCPSLTLCLPASLVAWTVRDRHRLARKITQQQESGGDVLALAIRAYCASLESPCSVAALVVRIFCV